MADEELPRENSWKTRDFLRIKHHLESIGKQLVCMSYLLPLPKSHHMPVESDHERVLLSAKVNNIHLITMDFVQVLFI